MIYNYRCLGCGDKIEISRILGSDIEDRKMCLKCGAVAIRIFEPTNIIFRGGGFYTNDKALYDHDEDEETV
jgi:predicted nucleic acid-binding Zn ribbon protein